MNRRVILPRTAERRSRHHWLWAFAVLSFGLGDAVTTALGVGAEGLVETGPVATPLLQQFGLVSMVVLKLAVFGAGYLAWRGLPRPHRVGIPLGLAVVGVVVTAWNSLLLLLVVVL